MNDKLVRAVVIVTMAVIGMTALWIGMGIGAVK